MLVSGGVRRFDSGSEFPGTRQQGMGGIGVIVDGEEQLFAFELALQHSRDDADFRDAQFTAEVSNLDLGTRVVAPVFAGSDWSWIAGVGLSVFRTAKDFDSTSLPGAKAIDTDAGLYGLAGVEWRVADGLVTQLEYRYHYEDLLDYGGFDLDHHQISLVFGYRF